MVSAWRCHPDDQLPNREHVLRSNLLGLRHGSPWPTLDALDRSAAAPPAGGASDQPAGSRTARRPPKSTPLTAPPSRTK
jgi:hypothetical protein